MTKVSPPVQDKETSRRPGRDALDRPLVKRFYDEVSVCDGDGGFHIELDRKPVNTPRRNILAVKTLPLAERIADEWRQQKDWIDPDTMSLTKLANTAIDRVSAHMEEVRQTLNEFAGSDLLCYRAETPEALAEQQRQHWDPVLNWLEETLGACFNIGAGVLHVAQPEESLAKIATYIERFDPFELSALHVMTTISGSVFLALALADKQLSLDEAWSAVHVDEDWQISQWGFDAEAEKRRKRRLGEIQSAYDFLHLSRN